MNRQYPGAPGLVLVLTLLLPGTIGAQSSWTVTVTPTMDPLPVGFCAAVHLTVFDGSSQEVPRNPFGYRVTIADFDIAVTPNGGSLIAKRIDASHWETCACQSAVVGTAATVTATYPARSLPDSLRLRGVTSQSSARFALSASKGKANPPGCVVGAAPATLASASSTGAPLGAPPTATASPPPAPAPPPATVTPLNSTPVTVLATGSTSSAATASPTGAPTVAPLASQPLGTRVAPVAGPPAPTPSFANATPLSLALVWPRLPGAVTYMLTRTQPNMPDKTVELSESQLQNTGFANTEYAGYQDTGLLPATVATYTVRAVYSDGRESSATVKYTMPPPVNPQGLAATQTGIDRVHLYWIIANTAPSYIMVFGPGSAQGGVKVSGAEGHYTVTGVPPGIQEWAVANYYEPGPVSTAAANFSRVRLAVTTPSSGRYRLSVETIRVDQQTIDPDADGHGDEVYVSAYVQMVDRRNMALGQSATPRSAIHGDAIYWPAPARVARGSASNMGGLKTGDVIPVVGQMVQGGWPDFVLWEGVLTDGIDQILVAPVLWESDDRMDVFQTWSTSFHWSILEILRRPEVVAAASAPGLNPVGFNTTEYAFQTVDLASSMDRPLGLRQIPGSPSDYSLVLRQWVVTITREKIEASLASASSFGGLHPA